MPMRIVSFKAENIKKLKVVEITPTGALVQITGPNGSGKSSVLDAIYWALAGQKAIDSKPVRAGQESAKITLDLGEVIVTRRFTEAGGTSLTVEATSGARFPSPQGMLDKLLGTLTFDPLAFSRAEPKAQLEMLRKLVPLEVDIDALDFDNRRDFEARTAVNRDAKVFKVRADALIVDETVEAIDIDALLAKMEEGATINRNNDTKRSLRFERTKQVEKLTLEIEQKRLDLMEHIERVNREIGDHTSALGAEQESLANANPIPEDVDITALKEQVGAAQKANLLVANRESRDGLLAQYAEAQRKADTLTESIEARTAARNEAIGKAAMPVDGLGFGEGEVTFNSLPFAQASSAEQLRVSVAIAMAGNPELRVLRIKDGSLLDESNLELIAGMAEAADYQVWIERVDTSGAVGVVMEDGSVAGASDA